MARRAAEKEAALRQGLTAGDGEARRTGALWRTDAWRQRAAASAAAASVVRTWPSSAPWLRWRRCRAAAAAGGGGERLHRHCDLCIAFDRFVAVDWFLVDVCAGLSWIHGDGSVENRTCRPRPAAAATAPWGSASRRTTAAAWRLRRSSRRARRALAARNSWSCWSCSAASSWCAMTGRAITTAVASQRRNQPKPPPQLKLDGDFRIPEMQ
nr:uncharacterized protein LOC9271569 isoform X1 [Oryza sativa Japonica Group]